MISTDSQPVAIHHVKHVDSLWVLCRRSDAEQQAGRQSIVVIKSAGQPGPHQTVHTEPVGHNFELVEDLFIPKEQVPRQVCTRGKRSCSCHHILSVFCTTELQ